MDEQVYPAEEGPPTWEGVSNGYWSGPHRARSRHFPPPAPWLGNEGLVLNSDGTTRSWDLAKAAERIPGWVERPLIPTLEARVRAIVKEEVGSLEKVLDARLEAVGAKTDSLEKGFPTVQELAEIKARLSLVESKVV